MTETQTITWKGGITLAIIIWVLCGIWFEAGPYTAISMFILVALFGYHCRTLAILAETMAHTTTIMQNMKNELVETQRIFKENERKNSE